MAGLPLIAALEVDVKQLTAAEGVALGQTDGDTRSKAVVGLAGDVALDVEVIGLVKHEVELQVERIVEPRGVTRGEVEVDEREDAGRREVVGALLMAAVAIELARHQAHVGQYGAHAHGWPLAVEGQREVAQGGVAKQGVTIRPAHLQPDVADGPAVARHLGNVSGFLKAELHLARHQGGVGEVGGIRRLVIEVTVVAEQTADARALGIERRDIEGVTLMDLSLGQGAVYQTVGEIGEVDVLQ